MLVNGFIELHVLQIVSVRLLMLTLTFYSEDKSRSLSSSSIKNKSIHYYNLRIFLQSGVLGFWGFGVMKSRKE